MRPFDALEEDVGEQGEISLEEALLRVDPRGAHASAVLFASLASTFCGGMGGAVAPFLMDPLRAEGDYTPWATSLLASSMFIGMWLGSFVGGVCCDAFGPGRVMISSLLGLSLFGAAPVASQSVAIVARILVGLSLCTTYQSSNTFVAESVVTSRRGTYLSLLHVSIAIGGLFTTGLAILMQGARSASANGTSTMPHAVPTVAPAVTHSPPSDANWRLLLGINSVPPLLVLLFAAPFVLRHESPRWLLVSGSPGACERLLRRIASSRGTADQPIPSLPRIAPQTSSGESHRGGGDDRSSSGGSNTCGSRSGVSSRGAEPSPARHHTFSPRRRCAELVSLWRLHAFGMVLCFCLNFGSKGSEIWVGTLVGELGLGWMSRIIYLMTMLGKILGDLTNIHVSRRWGRLRCLQLGFFGATISTLGFLAPSGSGGTAPDGASTREEGGGGGLAAAAILVLALLQGASIDLLWCNLYIYLVERFPTTVRSTGFGVAMGLGRSGGIVSSAMGGLVTSQHVAFAAYAGSFAVGGVVAMRPALETARRALVDSAY
jgi:MFS family permease